MSCQTYIFNDIDLETDYIQVHSCTAVHLVVVVTKKNSLHFTVNLDLIQLVLIANLIVIG
jgi:hypothetical protein